MCENGLRQFVSDGVQCAHSTLPRSQHWPISSPLSPSSTFAPDSASLDTLSIKSWAASVTVPPMGYLNDIDFLEAEEEEGREAVAREVEIDHGSLLSIPVPSIDHSRSPSPSIHISAFPQGPQPLAPSLSMGSSQSFTSSASTTSSGGINEWTLSQKRELAAHAEDVCREMDVPADEQRAFIENAQVCEQITLRIQLTKFLF